MTRRLTLALSLVVVLVLSACGPSVPPQVGVNSVALNLVLGKPPAEMNQAPAIPAPPAVPLPGSTLFGGGAFVFGPGAGSGGFTGFIVSPPSPPALVCPAADPRKGSIASTPEVQNAATDGAYPFRIDPSSSYSQNGSSASKFGSTFVATVSGAGPLTGPANPQNSPGEYTFNESQSIGGVTYNTSFQSQQTSSNPSNPLVGEETSQLGLSRFQIQLPANVGFTFNAPPGHALDILKTPANSSLTGTVTSGGSTSGTPPSWQDAVSDPADGSSMSINGAVTSSTPVQINACGQNIDTYPVTATLTFTAPPPPGGPVGFTGVTNLQWTLHYNVATGMGGLIVHEDGQTSCTSQPSRAPCELNGQPFSETFSFTVDSASPSPAQ
ncbi:MAG: hypothetical protein ACYDAC_06340 [Candidatus Dormibacteria bacterium]